MKRIVVLLLLLAGQPSWGAAPASAAAEAPPPPIIVLGDRNLPPYEFLEQGVAKGANVDLLRAIGRALGRPVEIRLMEWQQAQDEALAQRGRVLTMLGRTPEREQKFSFSHETVPVSFALFVRADDAQRLSASLAGRRVGVARGGLARPALLARHPEVVPVDMVSNLEGVHMLLRHEVDAIAAQEWSLYYLLGQLGTSTVTGLPPFDARMGTMAVARGDEALLAAINEGLERIKRSGELERILESWSGTRMRTVSESALSLAAGSALAGVALLAVLATLTLALRRRTRELGREIGERTRAQEELLRAKAQLEEADRSKDRFLATLGHELRNPLAAVANANAVLERSAADPQRVQWAQSIIGRQLDVVRRLTDDLQDVARINSGQLELRRELFVLQDLAADAIESLRPALARRQQRIETGFAPQPLHVHADRTRLHQIAVNLLGNAIRYSPEGGVIRVHVRRAGPLAELAVQDGGQGIAPDRLERVFELFFRGGGAAERAPGGLGLGLWLCRRLAALHGGTVRAESGGPGLGATFVVALPASGDLPSP